MPRRTYVPRHNNAAWFALTIALALPAHPNQEFAPRLGKTHGVDKSPDALVIRNVVILNFLLSGADVVMDS